MLKECYIRAIDRAIGNDKRYGVSFIFAEDINKGIFERRIFCYYFDSSALFVHLGFVKLKGKKIFMDIGVKNDGEKYLKALYLDNGERLI